MISKSRRLFFVIRPQQSFQARDERDHWRNSHVGLSVQATSERPSWPLQKSIIPEDHSYRFRYVNRVYHSTSNRRNHPVLIKSRSASIRLIRRSCYSLEESRQKERVEFTTTGRLLETSTHVLDAFIGFATFSTPKIEGKIINSKLGALHRTLRRPPR